VTRKRELAIRLNEGLVISSHDDEPLPPRSSWGSWDGWWLNESGSILGNGEEVAARENRRLLTLESLSQAWRNRRVWLRGPDGKLTMTDWYTLRAPRRRLTRSPNRRSHTDHDR